MPLPTQEAYYTKVCYNRSAQLKIRSLAKGMSKKMKELVAQLVRALR